MAGQMDETEYQCGKIRQMLPFMQHTLISSHLWPHLTAFLHTDDIRAIKCAERLDGNMAAVLVVLEKLMERRVKGWYRGLLDALIKEDRKDLVAYIEGTKDVKNMEIFHNLVQDAMFPNLIKTVDPHDILPDLVHTYKTLGQQDQEAIRCRIEQSGSIEGMIVLLERLPMRHPESWYSEFMVSLNRTGNPTYLDLVKEISHSMEDVDIIVGNPEKMAMFEEMQRNPQEVNEVQQLAAMIEIEESSGKKICKVPPAPQTLDTCPITEPRVAYSEQTNTESQLQSALVTAPPRTAVTRPVSSEIPLRLAHRPQPDGSELPGHRPLVSEHDERQAAVVPQPVDMFPTASTSNPQQGQSLSSSTDSNLETSSQGPLECPLCGWSTTDGASLERHVHHSHREELGTPESSLICPVCGIECEDTNDLMAHVDGHFSNQHTPDDDHTQSTSLDSDGNPGDGDEEAERGATAELKLRSYQEELAEKAMGGENVIIVAPTGSGKTHVALGITKTHLERMEAEYEGSGHVVFIVPTVELVSQQAKLFEKYLNQFSSCGMSGEIQDSQKVPLGDLVESNQILIMTPQIMVDALKNSTLESIGDITLMIFDECHHATKQHPYNRIMKFYLDEKLAEGGACCVLPQVVGLTASVGVGKARDIEKAMKHILSLCANLDCQDLATVNKHKYELAKHVNKPQEDRVETRGRATDPFATSVNSMMKQIENRMKRNPELPNVDKSLELEKLVEAAEKRGCDPYTQWLSRLEKQVARIHEQAIRRPYTTCITYLKAYNESLKINADCRTKDAFEYLVKTLKEIPSSITDQTDKELRNVFEEKKEIFSLISEDSRFENPKLKKLESILKEHEQKNSDMRAIIFCKTRDLTLALQNWMKDTKSLKNLNPSRVVGAQASSERGGMTSAQQENALSFFKNGKHKVIVATSVAEEGLDVQKCDLVIRYEYVTNEIAMVQARGRGRAEDARYVVLGERGRGTKEKEELNKIRERMMIKAIDKIKELKPQERVARILDLQADIKVEWDMKEIGKKTKEASKRHMPQTSWTLRCFKCDALCCFSDDLRLLEESHHTIIHQDFSDRRRVIPGPEKQKWGEIQQTDKIICVECNEYWGIVALYREVKFPIISIDKFVIIDNQSTRQDKCKKWKQVPFTVQKLSTADLQKQATWMAGEQL